MRYQKKAVTIKHMYYLILEKQTVHVDWYSFNNNMRAVGFSVFLLKKYGDSWGFLPPLPEPPLSHQTCERLGCHTSKISTPHDFHNLERFWENRMRSYETCAVTSIQTIVWFFLEHLHMRTTYNITTVLNIILAISKNTCCLKVQLNLGSCIARKRSSFIVRVWLTRPELCENSRTLGVATFHDPRCYEQARSRVNEA